MIEVLIITIMEAAVSLLSFFSAVKRYTPWQNIKKSKVAAGYYYKYAPYIFFINIIIIIIRMYFPLNSMCFVRLL